MNSDRNFNMRIEGRNSIMDAEDVVTSSKLQYKIQGSLERSKRCIKNFFYWFYPMVSNCSLNVYLYCIMIISGGFFLWETFLSSQLIQYQGI